MSRGLDFGKQKETTEYVDYAYCMVWLADELPYVRTGNVRMFIKLYDLSGGESSCVICMDDRFAVIPLIVLFVLIRSASSVFYNLLAHALHYFLC